MTRVALLFATGTEECEALNVADILRRAGMDLSIVSISGDKKVTGSHDITIIADELIEDHDFSKDDVLVIPGGMPGTKNMDGHELVQKAIKELYDSNRYVCAICAAPTILGKGGYLKDKNACVYPGNEDKLIGAKVNFEPVNRDGNVITSRGLGTAISFALEIVSALQGSEKAAEMAAKIVFNA